MHEASQTLLEAVGFVVIVVLRIGRMSAQEVCAEAGHGGYRAVSPSMISTRLSTVVGMLSRSGHDKICVCWRCGFSISTRPSDTVLEAMLAEVVKDLGLPISLSSRDALAPVRALGMQRCRLSFANGAIGEPGGVMQKALARDVALNAASCRFGRPTIRSRMAVTGVRSEAKKKVDDR